MTGIPSKKYLGPETWERTWDWETPQERTWDKTLGKEPGTRVPAPVWTDKQAQNITFARPSDVGGKNGNEI